MSAFCPLLSSDQASAPFIRASSATSMSSWVLAGAGMCSALHQEHGKQSISDMALYNIHSSTIRIPVNVTNVYDMMDIKHGARSPKGHTCDRQLDVLGWRFEGRQPVNEVYNWI